MTSIMTLAELLGDRPLYVIEPERRVSEACRLMAKHRIGALPVVRDTQLVGILSERDVVARCVARGRSADFTQVAQIMTPDPRRLAPGNRLTDALILMMDGHFRHLPICRGGVVVGMVSLRDFPLESHVSVHRMRGAA